MARLTKGPSRVPRRSVAIHEAGHAVAAIAVRRGVHGATIVPEAEIDGRVRTARFGNTFRPDIDLPPGHQRLLEAAILVLMAGHEAERIDGRRGRRGDTIDLITAANLAAHACGSDEEIEALMELQRVRAHNILRLRWNAVLAVAGALLAEKSVSGPRIRALVAEATVPKPTPGAS